MPGPGDAAAVGTVALAARLAHARDRIVVLRQRVAEAESQAPRRQATGWDGPAALAYQLSLDLLRYELTVAAELLRSAADLMSAAVWELGSDE
jgi:hypothetical protein